jgi:hypothetical protein
LQEYTYAHDLQPEDLNMIQKPTSIELDGTPVRSLPAVPPEQVPAALPQPQSAPALSSETGKENDRLLPAAQVRERYSVTAMSLWRWLKNPTLAFPAPIVINTRRYWRLSDLIDWELRHSPARTV